MNGDKQLFLREKAFHYGIQLSSYQLDLFRIYLDELWHWNQRINLTGLSTRRAMLVDLFLDSIIPAPFLPQKGILLDVGSGAGFPGVPIKIHSPQIQVHLLEANSKKVSFLKQILRLLGLKDIEVIKGRIEKDGHRLYSEGYNLITARALAPLPRTLTWCAPFLRPGGLLVSFLGSGAEEDLRQSQKVMERHQLLLNKMVPYFLPGKRAKRNIVIFKKGLINKCMSVES